MNKYKINEDLYEDALKNLSEDVRLYGISGKMGSGKDSLAIALASKVRNMKLLAFAETVRSEIMSLFVKLNLHKNEMLTLSESMLDIAYCFKITEEDTMKLFELIDRCPDLINQNPYESRTPEMRGILQVWGTEIRRKSNENYWIEQTANIAYEYIAKGYSVCITDVRFPNEADAVKELGGKLVRIACDDDVRIARMTKRDGIAPNKEKLNHESELALSDYNQFDIFLDSTNENANTLATLMGDNNEK